MLCLLRRGIRKFLQFGGPELAEVGEEDDEEDFHPALRLAKQDPTGAIVQAHTVPSSSSTAPERATP